MFWRLFLTFLSLIIASIGLVVLLVLRQSGGSELFRQIIDAIWVELLLLTCLALIPAFVLAKAFSHPVHQLIGGARHLAEGNLRHKFEVNGSREFIELANSFNAMSDKLSATIAQLERDREQLRTILSGMVEGVIAIDNDQRVLFVNQRAADLLGFPADSAHGRKLWEVSRQQALAGMIRAVLDGEGPLRQEFDWNGPNTKNLAVYASRLPGPSSPGAVMVLHDTTELRRLERLRQDFVANVSHELKTPLANIKSSVEALLDGAMEEPQPRDNFLAEIDEQSDRLDALIQDLLTLARIESGESGLEFQPVLIDDAVNSSLDRHRTRAEAKGLVLTGVALGPNSADLTAIVDEEGLAHILDNLVDNAIKYTQPGGRVTVRWKDDGDNVAIEVEDTGYGIPLRDQPRIFERFYRVDKARSRELGGTGLGLSIVKHLVQAMRGTVKVTSELNKGSTFHLTFPKADPHWNVAHKQEEPTDEE